MIEGFQRSGLAYNQKADTYSRKGLLQENIGLLCASIVEKPKISII